MTRALLLVALLASCRERELPPDARPSSVGPVGAAAATTTRILYPSAPGSFVDLIAGAKHGVVAIHAATPVKAGPAAMFPGAPEATADVALGTGFLVSLTASPFGDAAGRGQAATGEAGGIYVVTTEHIATASSDLRVVLPDRTAVPAKLVGTDPRLDLALLSIAEQSDVSRKHLQPLPLGDSNGLEVGEWLVALGDPFGDDVTASAGIVSATGREGAGSLAAGRMMGYRTFIQTDARIHRGNSGGPVIDTAGQVVGVADATGDRLGEVSFAVPIERVREVIGQLKATGTVARSWLGVKVLPVTAETADKLNMPRASGALVTEVEADSPGARAGLRANDVILTWDNREVDHRSLPWIVAQTPAGKAIAVGLWRNHTNSSTTVVTEKMRE
jgi:serine protease Do